MALEKINQVNDIKEIPPEEYDTLAAEIREFLVGKISESGGPKKRICPYNPHIRHLYHKISTPPKIAVDLIYTVGHSGTVTRFTPLSEAPNSAVEVSLTFTSSGR